jgi:hypothetical protein
MFSIIPGVLPCILGDFLHSQLRDEFSKFRQAVVGDGQTDSEVRQQGQTDGWDDEA